MKLRDLLRKLWTESTSEAQPTLDLHGLSVKEALDLTRRFVETSFRSGISPIRIVYGKGLGSPGGVGILREVIPRWCEKDGKAWVESFQREVDLKGGDGSVLLFLRKTADPSEDTQTTRRGPSSISE